MNQTNPQLDRSIIATKLFKSVLGLVTGTLLLTACSASHSSPFFMYSSPLLDGDMRAQRSTDSSYDPFSTDKSPDSKRSYVLEKPSTSRTNSQTTRPYRPNGNQPVQTAQNIQNSQHALTLSTHKTTPTLTPSNNKRTNDSKPTHAADYAWSMYAINNTTLPDDARHSIPTLYRTCRETGEIFHHTKPRVGDLAFFHNTMDANRDTRNNDWYTHVAIVENISPSGNTDLLGYDNGQVRRFHMNLEQIDTAYAPDKTIVNSTLRSPTNNDAPFTQYLSSQLFAGFCSLLGQQSELNIVDNWQPGMALNP